MAERVLTTRRRRSDVVASFLHRSWTHIAGIFDPTALVDSYKTWVSLRLDRQGARARIVDTMASGLSGLFRLL